MMKIGFDAKRYFNNQTGLGNYSRWLINELASDASVEPILFYPSKTAPESDLKVVTPGSLKLSTSLWRVRGMVKDLEQNGIQIYHGLSNEIPFGIHKTSISTVVTIHDLIQKRYPENYSGIDRRIYNRKVQYAQKYADVIIVPSIQTKKDLINYFGTEENKIKIIPLGLPKISKANESSPHNKPYILCVSGFSRRKNLVRLVRAYKDSSIKDVDLIIAGQQGDAFKRVQYLSRNSENIRIITDLSSQAIADLYAHAEFCVYPSMYEGFGLPVLEAMQHGKTLAVSKTSSLTEVGGDAVIYFDPEKVDSIKHGLETLYFSEKHRTHLEAQIPRQLEKFKSADLIKKYAEMYTSLLAKSL